MHWNLLNEGKCLQPHIHSNHNYFLTTLLFKFYCFKYLGKSNNEFAYTRVNELRHTEPGAIHFSEAGRSLCFITGLSNLDDDAGE